jgi:hypothetical protein
VAAARYACRSGAYMQNTLFPLPAVEKDIVYTPDDMARTIVSFYHPQGKCLDPCKGNGAFLRYLPTGSDWCEIREGRDFFKYNEHVDWIVGNPPYSIFAKWLYHSMDIADHIVYLVPSAKLFYSYKTAKLLFTWGGITHNLIIGPGSWLGFPLGYIVSAMYLQRGYKGGMVTTIWTPPNNRLHATPGSAAQNWLFN